MPDIKFTPVNKIPAPKAATGARGVYLEAFKYLRANPGKAVKLEGRPHTGVAARINSGQVKLSQCRDGGDSTIDGMATRMVHYTVTLPGAPAASATLYVGKSDGLPYAQTTDTAKIRYRYRGVTAPKP